MYQTNSLRALYFIKENDVLRKYNNIEIREGKNDKIGKYLVNENKKMINYICYEQYNKNDYNK